MSTFKGIKIPRKTDAQADALQKLADSLTEELGELGTLAVKAAKLDAKGTATKDAVAGGLHSITAEMVGWTLRNLGALKRAGSRRAGQSLISLTFKQAGYGKGSPGKLWTVADYSGPVVVKIKGAEGTTERKTFDNAESAMRDGGLSLAAVYKACSTPRKLTRLNLFDALFKRLRGQFWATPTDAEPTAYSAPTSRADLLSFTEWLVAKTEAQSQHPPSASEADTLLASMDKPGIIAAERAEHADPTGKARRAAAKVAEQALAAVSN